MSYQRAIADWLAVCEALRFAETFCGGRSIFSMGAPQNKAVLPRSVSVSTRPLKPSIAMRPSVVSSPGLNGPKDLQYRIGHVTQSIMSRFATLR